MICILITLLSFRFSIKALEDTIPALGEYYLQGKPDAFNRHLQSVWSKAIDWCTVGQITFFALGVTLTLIFVIANVREDRMTKPEGTQKVVTGDLGKALKPAAMTPLNEGVKPAAMTPVATGGEHRGLQSVPMTPTPTQAPVQPASANTPAQPAPSPKQ